MLEGENNGSRTWLSIAVEHVSYTSRSWNTWRLTRPTMIRVLQNSTGMAGGLNLIWAKTWLLIVGDIGVTQGGDGYGFGADGPACDVVGGDYKGGIEDI